MTNLNKQVTNRSAVLQQEVTSKPNFITDRPRLDGPTEQNQ